MDEVIDLRPYVDGLLRRWWVVVGTLLVAIALAVLITQLLPVTYQATALIAVTEPSQLLQFDPRFESVAEELPLLEAYPELAVSDTLLTDVLEQLPAETRANVETLAKLKDILEAESGVDPRLIRLHVRYRDPATTAVIANTWAREFVDWANELYGYGGEQEAQFFEAQLVEAQQTLSLTEQALIDFQEQNRFTIFDNQLAALSELQAAYLANQQTLTFTLADAQALRSQLATSNDSLVNLADQVTALLLQTQAYNTGSTLTIPLQLQFSADTPLTSTSRAEQMALLNSLTASITQSLTEITANLAALEPQILMVQQQRQEAFTESTQLEREYQLAEESYLALARKVEEERILAEDTSSGVRLASEAAAPLDPVSPSLLLNVAVAIILGLLLGVLIVFVLVWRELRPATVG